MKTYFSSLKCPHCGAQDYEIIEKDIFCCNYCSQKFNYDLDDIDLSSENKIFIEELKKEFYNKLNELNEKKRTNKIGLLYYSKKANNRKVSIIFLTLFLISILFINLVYVIPFSVLFFILWRIAVKFNKINYNKYYPIASKFALRIIKIDNEIVLYTKLISKIEN